MVERREEVGKGLPFGEVQPSLYFQGLRTRATQVPGSVRDCHKDEGSQGSPSSPYSQLRLQPQPEALVVQPSYHPWAALPRSSKSALIVKSSPTTVETPEEQLYLWVGYLVRSQLVEAMEQCEPAWAKPAHPSGALRPQQVCWL